METFIQIVGWIGTLLVILAYFFISNKKLDSSSKLYQLMNLFGAVGVGMNAFFQQAYPSFGIQIIWGFIALATLVRTNSNATPDIKKV